MVIWSSKGMARISLWRNNLACRELGRPSGQPQAQRYLSMWANQRHTTFSIGGQPKHENFRDESGDLARREVDHQLRPGEWCTGFGAGVRVVAREMGPCWSWLVAVPAVREDFTDDVASVVGEPWVGVLVVRQCDQRA